MTLEEQVNELSESMRPLIEPFEWFVQGIAAKLDEVIRAWR